MAGTAAGIALLLGAGGLAWAMAGSDGDEDPVVKVTAVDPATTVAPSTAPATTLAATTVPPTTLAPTTLPPTTAPPTTAPPAPVQAAPPVVAPAAQQPAAPAAPKRKQPSQQAPATTAAPHVDPPTHPPAPPADVVGFSAGAAFGSCSEDPPYDVYSGTASPGTTVTISSAFGGGSAQADEHGHWEAEGRVQRCPPQRDVLGDGQLCSGLRHLQFHPYRVNRSGPGQNRPPGPGRTGQPAGIAPDGRLMRR